MDILDIFLDILLKPPQPLMGLFFYTENPLELIADLLKIFEKYLDSIQIYNKVVQGTPIPHHRVLFFIERISKGLYAKWHVLQTPTQILLS